MFSGASEEHCGCFGEFIKISPSGSLIKNLILMGLTWYLIQNNSSETQGIKRKWLIPSIIALMSFIFVFLWLPVRSVEGNIFTKYTHFEPTESVDLNSGEYIIAVFNLDCPDCQQAARELGQIDEQLAGFPEIYFLFWGEETVTVEQFFAITFTDYPYTEITMDEFFDLIGEEPPRIYWIRNGEIKQYWDSNFTENLREAFIEK
jgi:hypothetical protein